MADLESARGRLERALERLERAVVAGGGPGEQDPALAEELEALRGECARLNAALEEARREYQELKQRADRVAERLGSTIEEIDELLES